VWKEYKLETQERYRKRWKKHGYDPQTLGWNKDCQWVRFEAALEGLHKEDYESVIDFGCGFGDLLGYLRMKGWRGSYTGIDIVEELVTEAVERHALNDGAAFICSDIGEFSPSTKATMAIALGMFNHRLRQNNLEFVRETIELMWEVTTKVVICDFLSSLSEPLHRRDDLFYADPRELYALATGYSRRVLIHHAYMPFEFQLKIWHDDSFSKSAPVFGPYAHLAHGQTKCRQDKSS